MTEMADTSLDSSSAFPISECNPTLLSEKDEKVLGRRSVEGDPDAVTDLVMSNLGLVVTIAKKYVSSNIPLTEIIEAGNTGLFVAAKNFDPDKGRFSSFARHAIEGEIVSFLKDSSFVIKLTRTATTRRKDIEKCKEKGIRSDDEIANELGLSAKKVRDASQYPSRFVPVDELCEQTHSYNGEAMFHSEILLVKQKEIVAQLIDFIPKERDREIIRLRFGLGAEPPKSQAEIGRIFHVTEEAIRQREKNTLQRLCYHLKRQGISLDLINAD